MIRPYQGAVPRIAVSAYVDESAQVMGKVEIGERSSVWPNATLRGDIHSIRIGEDTNIQDNSCVHVDYPDYPVVVGNRVTVGHSVTLHGCVVEDECLIGIGATVLNGAVVRSGAIVAAGALVTEGMEVPGGTMVMGVPARVRRELTAQEREGLRESAAHYVAYSRTYKEDKI